MTKLTPKEFVITAKKIVGDAAGWEARIADKFNAKLNTIEIFKVSGTSHGFTQIMHSALGIEDEHAPSFEDSVAHYTRMNARRAVGQYSSV